MSEFITKVVIAADNQTAPAVTAATKGIQNYAKAATAAQSQVRAASRQGRAALQQLGYQVQDISVQLQAGQSPFVVLAQQGSQVASIFGPGGAVLGALIAVGGAIAGSLIPNLFNATNRIEEMEKKAKELGKTLQEAAPEAYAEVQSKTADKVAALNAAIEAQRLVIKRLGLESEGKLGMGAISAIPEELENKKEELRQAKIVLEDLLFDLNLATAFKGGGGNKYEPKNAFIIELERREAAQQKINQALEAAKSPLQKLNDLEAEYNKLNQEGYLSDLDRLVLLGDLEIKREELNKKADEGVDILDKEAKAYENLKRALDPAYGAYQSYYETVTQINNSADTQANKITLIAVAYAKLYESLGLVANQQEKVKHKIEQTTEKVDPTPLEKYKDSIKSVDWSMEQMAANGLKSMEDGLTNFIMGTGNAADAFKSMARSIVSDLIRMQIQQSITGPLSGLLQGMSLFGGAPMTSAGATPGVSSVGGPIAPVPSFNMEGGGYTGSGIRSGGVDGKGGMWGILHPNESVIDHTQGGGSGVTVVQNINVSTGVQQTVRAEIQNLLPQITQATKQAVADSRQRGGGFSKALVGA